MKFIKTVIVAAAMLSTAGLIGCGGKDEPCADTASCETATGAATGGTTATGATGS